MNPSILEVLPLAAAKLKLQKAREAGGTAPTWEPLPHQGPPDGDWSIWVLRAGRGAGKTEAGARFVLRQLRERGRIRVAVGAPTLGDVRDICAEGETGLITIAPNEFPVYNRSLMEARHVNGGYVKFMGSEKPGRWNGPQWHVLWADELALWNEESWHQAQFGVRLGAHPLTIATTTPKARKFVKKLESEPGVVVTRARMQDNPHLSPLVQQRLLERYGGTRLGRQEIDGEFVDEVEGALWRSDWIDLARVVDPPFLSRIVVAIDPAVTHGDESDETGICVAGVGADADYYILHCRGYRLSPNGWAERAIALYDHWQADRIIAERNNGGEMVEATIRLVRQDVSLKTIVASRGKAVRAEPIAALYERGKVHHVGVHTELEEQQSSFPVANEHDDLVDALVYAVTELSEGGGKGEIFWA